MERYERMLKLVAAVYFVFVVILGLYLYFGKHEECSSDGYLLIHGQPAYQNGVPIKCRRLPL